MAEPAAPSVAPSTAAHTQPPPQESAVPLPPQAAAAAAAAAATTARPAGGLTETVAAPATAAAGNSASPRPEQGAAQEAHSRTGQTGVASPAAPVSQASNSPVVSRPATQSPAAAQHGLPARGLSAAPSQPGTKASVSPTQSQVAANSYGASAANGMASQPAPPMHTNGVLRSPNQGGVAPAIPVDKTDAYSALSRAVQSAPSAILRQVLRDNWQACFLGSEYHLAFLLNATLHQANAPTLQRALRDFGDKMLSGSSHLLPQHLHTVDMDESADLLLNKASNDFLDKALARRLETITGRRLVNSLARAERLGYNVQDIVEETDNSKNESVIPSIPPQAAAHAPSFSQPPVHYPYPPPPQYQGQQYPPHSYPPQQYPPQGYPPQQYPPGPPPSTQPQWPPSVKGYSDKGRVAKPSKSTKPASGAATTGPNGIVYCPHCYRPCSGPKALHYHEMKSACEESIDVNRLGKDTCLHCGCRFGSSGGLHYHEKSEVCGTFTEKQSSTVRGLLQNFVPRRAPAAPTLSTPSSKQYPTHRTPKSAGVAGRKAEEDPYADLNYDTRRRLEGELGATEQKYSVLFREALQMPEPQQSEMMAKLKNRYNAKQSTTRKKYGVRLKGSRTRAEIDAERTRLFGSTDGPTLHGSDAGTPRDAWASGRVSSTPTRPRPGTPQKIVPVSEMGGLTGSSATAEMTDPTAHLTASQPRHVPTGTQHDPMAIDDPDSESSSESDSDSDDEDIPAQR